MAQKAFMADAGIRLGEWSIVELANGDLQVSNVYTVSGSQKLFRVDKGLRIGDWRMTVDNNGDMNLSETAITGSQRPFIADGGVKVGEWTLHATQDGDLFAEKNAEIINYNLSCNYSTVNEGDTLTITLTTTGIGAGTILPYTISGVDSADIDGASLTGNFVVGTTDSITLNITADTTTEGEETLQISLDGIGAMKTIPISDTSDAGSIDLSQYTYTVALTSDATGQEVTSVNEGENYTITTTTDAPDGTYLWVHLVENNEFNESGQPHYIDWLMDGTQSLARKPPVSGGGTTTSLSISADNITEAGFEKFTVKISIADEFADVPDNYVTQTPEITINDTSQDPVSTPTYSISQSHTGSVDEGTSVTFTLNTTNVDDGTILYYTTSYSSGNGGSSNQFDFTGANAGQVTVNNNTTSFTVLVSADMATESGNNEYEGFYGNFGTSYSYLDYVATSQVIEINDTSQAPTGPQAPSVGTYMYGGETIAPGWWESHWNGSNTLTVKFDTSSTSTAGWGTTNDQWEYVLDDWAAGNGTGDTIEIRGDGGLRVLTINGSVTKTQIGSSDTYYYAIPVSVTTGTMSTSAGYIVTPLYLQHQYNG